MTRWPRDPWQDCLKSRSEPRHGFRHAQRSQKSQRDARSRSDGLTFVAGVASLLLHLITAIQFGRGAKTVWNIYHFDPTLLSVDWRLSDLVGVCGTMIDLSIFLMLRRGLMDGRGCAYPLMTAIASALSRPCPGKDGPRWPRTLRSSPPAPGRGPSLSMATCALRTSAGSWHRFGQPRSHDTLAPDTHRMKTPTKPDARWPLFFKIAARRV
jgi:hypothetical protein